MFTGCSTGLLLIKTINAVAVDAIVLMNLNLGIGVEQVWPSVSK
jgi:hypothetical protein